MDAQPSYLCEVFPSDYTDFETESEIDDHKTKHSLPAVSNFALETVTVSYHLITSFI